MQAARENSEVKLGVLVIISTRLMRCCACGWHCVLRSRENSQIL